ncbi:Coenzyme PQQ synthesis protein A [Cupriavidus basilensis]|uniref:Coenzyme PQQ synthesis protein A n=3 Tax=Cupriavidus basilensis TaxID=68895 RepID=A0A0C4Y9T6_9BURK|nr:Coenzyme PQQ synthesis protein A [Cupriavidus basilensis]
MDVASERTRRCPPQDHTLHSLTMPPRGGDMNWTTPAYKELRLGFEITMYIANR